MGLAVSSGESVDDHDINARERVLKVERPAKGRTVSTPVRNRGWKVHAGA
jgi:hypothetical protein